MEFLTGEQAGAYGRLRLLTAPPGTDLSSAVVDGGG
jgi:hypothetical protein